MGFDQKIQATASRTAEPLWSQYRDEFPVTQNLIYLNHAAVAPLPRRAAAAMQALARGRAAISDRCTTTDGWMPMRALGLRPPG